MYLISVEGGDGSGKGEAARILGELLSEFPFPDVVMTHEPRRHSELGKLALQSVKLGNKTPLEEAGLFAADRLDHSHTFIRPHLAKGAWSSPTGTSTRPSSTRAWLATSGLKSRWHERCRHDSRPRVLD